jgi:excisionase family DNA binding protein
MIQENSNQNVRLMSLRQASSYLGISYWSVRSLIDRGDLPAVRFGRRLLIDKKDLDSLVEARKEKLG